jgi:hypothetical protein
VYFLIVAYMLFAFQSEACKTAPHLKPTDWKLLKLPAREASRSSRFEPGILPQNLFSK